MKKTTPILLLIMLCMFVTLQSVNAQIPCPPGPPLTFYRHQLISGPVNPAPVNVSAEYYVGTTFIYQNDMPVPALMTTPIWGNTIRYDYFGASSIAGPLTIIEGHDVKRLIGNELVVSGKLKFDSNPQIYLFVMRINGFGAPTWLTILPLVSTATPNRSVLSVANTGNVLLSATTSDGITDRILIARINEFTGAAWYTREIAVSTGSGACTKLTVNNMIPTQDDGYIVVGAAGDLNYTDGYIFKFAPGTIAPAAPQWHYLYNTRNASGVYRYSEFFDVKNDGVSYIAVGHTGDYDFSGGGTFMNGVIAEVNTLGLQVQAREFVDNNYQKISFHGIALMGFGFDWGITGYAYDANSGNTRHLFTRVQYLIGFPVFNSLVYVNSITFSNYETGWDIFFDQGFGFVMTGSTNVGGFYYPTVTKVDSSGQMGCDQEINVQSSSTENLNHYPFIFMALNPWVSTNDEGVLLSSVCNNSTSLCSENQGKGPTGLNLPELTLLEVKSYPNPAGDKITIDINSGIADQVTIRLYDATGREVLSNRHSVYKGSQSIELPLEGLPEGVYFIKIQGTQSYPSLKIQKD